MKKTLFLLLFSVLLGQLGKAAGHQVNITLAKHITCGGVGDGKIYATVTGGVGPFEYAWSPILGTGDTLDNLFADTYTCTVMDLSDSSIAIASIVVEDGDWYANSGFIYTMTPSLVCDGGYISVYGPTDPTVASQVWTGPPGFSDDGVNLWVMSASQSNSGWYYKDLITQTGCHKRDSMQFTVGAPFVFVLGNNNDESTCPNGNDGVIRNASYGGTPPLSFYVNLYNDPSNFIYSANDTFPNLMAGVYTYKIVDSWGCIDSSVVGLSGPGMAQVSHTYQSPTDSISCNGQITINVIDGAMPYTYTWSPAVSNGPVASNICSGSYTVTINDAYGCLPKTEIITICPVGATVSGSVYMDADNDCVKDPTENSIVPMYIVALDSTGQEVAWAYVNSGNGTYALDIINALGTYTLELRPVSGNADTLFTFTCTNNIIDLNYTCQTIQNVNLAYKTQHNNDLRVNLFSGIARPGFDRLSTISYLNLGVDTLNATVSFKMDALETYVNAFPTPSLVSGGLCTWNVGNLIHGAGGSIYISTNVPAIQSGGILGTILNDTAWITPLAGDENPLNNISATHNAIQGSYDPNMKEVTASNMNPDGSIDTSMTALIYTVYFQNTGTDTAFNIKVRDNISSHLQLSSLEILNASHPYTVRFLADHTLELSFDNILLPDSNVNELMSHGYFQYKIWTKDNILEGDTIFNKADIYFDFNLPVVTNTVATPVKVNVVGVSKSEKVLNFVLYPNPTNAEQVTCSWTTATNETGNINVYDISGKLMKTQSVHSNTNNTIDLNGLSNGIYFYSIHTNEGTTINGKVVLVD